MWGGKNSFTKRVSRLTDLYLVALFFIFYLFTLALSKEIAFDMSVDQGIAREAAKDVAHQIPFGYQYIFSLYHNNLPITYIMGRLYRLAENLLWFRHDPEYLWVMVGCLMTTGAGFCCCEIVKKLTENVFAVVLSFVLYLLTAGLNPWKTVPYTDSYGIFFPVLCILLYLCSKDCKSYLRKIILLFLAVLAGMAGGFVKPSGYIIVLAVSGAEGLSLLETLFQTLCEKKSSIKCYLRGFALQVFSFVLLILFVLTGYWGTKLCKDYMIVDMQLEYNEEIEATWQYYLYLGSNDQSTGSFNYEDFAVFGEFQDSKEERNAVCLERAFKRIAERGILGNMYFCLLKLVRSFNDGTFAWQDVQYYEPFPEDFTHDDSFAQLARSLFSPGGTNQVKYNTAAEMVWIFILLGIPGILFFQKKKSHYVVFPILVIGILVYLMLFESGARYVYIFLPLFVSMSVCGMAQMGTAILSISRYVRRFLSQQSWK